MGDVRKIAIVDDDRGIRKALEGMIRSLGHVPLSFASAELFLASVERGDVACVVLDIRMPGMSGLDLQDALNAQGSCPPLIFMTSYGDERTRARALAGGAHCFLGKPVEDTRLIACIHASLERG